MEATPTALRTIVKRFAGARRRHRLNLASGSTSVQENGILRVRLPRGLVDMASFNVHADFATDDANDVCLGAHTLIRRVVATIGGVNVGAGNNHWGLTAHAMNVSTQSLEWCASNANSGAYPFDGLTNGDTIDFNYWALSPLGMGMVATQFTGDVEIELQFAGVEALVTAQGAAPDSADGFTLSNIFATIDVIELEDDTYLRSIASALQGGATYQKSMDLATSQVQENNGANSFNVSCASLQKVLVAPKASAYTTKAAQSAGQMWSNYLDAPVGAAYPADNYGFYLTINGMDFPSYGHGNDYSQLAQITRSCYGASPYNYNMLFYQTDASGSTIDGSNPQVRKDAFVDDNGFVLFPVGAFDEEGREGGIDLSSGNSLITINTQGANLLSRKLLMAGIHRSKVECRSGQVVSVVL